MGDTRCSHGALGNALSILLLLLPREFGSSQACLEVYRLLCQAELR